MDKKKIVYVCAAIAVGVTLVALPELAEATTSASVSKEIAGLNDAKNTVTTIVHKYIVPTVVTVSLVGALFSSVVRFNIWHVGGFIGTAILASTGEGIINMAATLTF